MFERIHNTKERIFFSERAENHKAKSGFLNHSNKRNYQVMSPSIRHIVIQPQEYNHLLYEPVHEVSNNVVCATSKASDQPAHTRSLIRAFPSRLSIL